MQRSICMALTGHCLSRTDPACNAILELLFHLVEEVLYEFSGAIRQG
ncbi:hypothetical protein [Streptomyces sp. NPDC006552]